MRERRFSSVPRWSAHHEKMVRALGWPADVAGRARVAVGRRLIPLCAVLWKHAVVAWDRARHIQLFGFANVGPRGSALAESDASAVGAAPTRALAAPPTALASTALKGWSRCPYHGQRAWEQSGEGRAASRGPTWDMRRTARSGPAASGVNSWAVPSGEMVPAAAFRNPFRGGRPEIVFFQDGEEAGSGQILRLGADAPVAGEWRHQVVSDQVGPPTAFVTTMYQGLVQAYWSDKTGLLWRSLLTSAGFSSPMVLRWASPIDVLRSTYFLPPDGRAAEPVLYGVARDADGGQPHLWIRTLHEPPASFALPDALKEGADFNLSMTGRRSWVIDAAQDGYLRRWDGRMDGGMHDLLTYTMAGLEVEQVFGGCGRAELYFPQPQFLARDGLAYLWNPRTGAVPCTTAGRLIVRAMSVGTVHGDSLVYLVSRDGRLSVTRQVAPDGMDPRWLGSRVISREMAPDAQRLVPLTHPDEQPAVFVLDERGLSLLTPSGGLAEMPWDLSTT